MRILNVPDRFSQRWIERNVPRMESTEFHATFHEAATRGWSENELRRLAKMWGASAPGRDHALSPGLAGAGGSGVASTRRRFRGG